MTDNVIDFVEYNRLRKEGETSEVLRNFEKAVVAQIMSQPLTLARKLGDFHRIFRDIKEASRRPLPAMCFDTNIPLATTMDSIRIPMADYERLKRLDEALCKAEDEIYKVND